MSRVWLLNLDVELEVEGRAPYAGPLAAIAKRPELLSLLAPLVPPEDELLLTEPTRGSHEGTRGLSWSSSPRSTACLHTAGADVVRPLELETLHRVMSRGFSASLGLNLPGSSWSQDLATALAHVRLPSPSGRWLVRRAFGFAGKARRAFCAPQAADERFVSSAALEGGVLIEPFVTVTADFGLHGFVDDERLVLGDPVKSEVGAGGVFRSARRTTETDLASGERAALVAEATRAGQALRAAGYQGPFGVDAFRYTLAGAERFQPRCEINARYSMAWATGMGDRRPDLE